jgi:GTP-binding protein EngB required for normal cell division
MRATNSTESLLAWYKNSLRPFLELHVPDRVRDFDGDLRRLEDLAAKAIAPVSVCFLGHAAIGKSTLMNALVAGPQIVLPAGGVGPLTAQATTVLWSKDRSFEASYHPRKQLWELTFVLERRHAMTKGAALVEEREFGDELSEEVRGRLLREVDEAATEAEGEVSKNVDRGYRAWEKQARLLATGNQDSPAEVGYIIDVLRTAMGLRTRWGNEVRPEDESRVASLRKALEVAKSGGTYRLLASDVSDEIFRKELGEHSSGSLAPLIRELKLFWPSELLTNRLQLVDLPGIGIANDVYKEVTRAWINGNSRAVVLVVDRAGVTEACAALLHDSGFLLRLLASADDPDADPMTLIVAVTRVDDVAETRWAENKSRKKREHFAEVCAQIVPRIREQMKQHLDALEVSSHELVSTRQREVVTRVLSELSVFPLSAPQYRKALEDHEDDRGFLPDIGATGVPAFAGHLNGLSSRWLEKHDARARDLATNLLERLEGCLNLVRAQWEQQTHAEEEANKLRQELQVFVAPLRERLHEQRGAFREFLQQVGETQIPALVKEALTAAAKDMRRQLKPFEHAHWATLRAAVRRDGVWDGATNIDLPSRFTDACQSPIIAIWGERILKQIRERTRDEAHKYAQLVEGVADWAEKEGARVQSNTVREQRDAIRAEARALERVGKEIVDELREDVRKQLHDAIRKPIARRCQKFVEEKRDQGAGVKRDMLGLLHELPDQVAEAVEYHARKRLADSFEQVRQEIDDRFQKMADPIEAACEAIVASHASTVRRSDAQKRKRTLESIESLQASMPKAGGSFDFDEAEVA